MVILRSIRWPRKEVQKRLLYKKYEIKKLVLKSLLNNYSIDIIISSIIVNYLIVFQLIVQLLDIEPIVCYNCKVNLFSDLSNYLDIWWNIVQIMVF